MTVFHQQFSTSEIILATGVTNDQLQNWLRRGLIVGQEDIAGGGSPGRHRRFSYFNLIEVAVAKALIEVGLTDLKVATRAAQSFAHSGDGPLPGRPGRVPGCPFHVAESITLLIVGPHRCEDYLLTAKDHSLALVAAIKGHGVGAVVIDATEVFETTLRRLDIDPVAVMQQAYGD